jgi:diaminopimelate epimerase
MPLPFWKMHGAGNDFVLIDDRALAFPAADAACIARICDRHRGVGAEGLLLLQPSDRAHFRMRFFNPDGGEADLCGNGARCIARLALELGAAPADMRIETAAGIVRAECSPPLVRLYLPEPKDWRLNLRAEWQGREWPVHFVNSGVPHAVCFVEQLADLDVHAFGAHLRNHPLFAPAGTNADFARILGENSLALRTYERGVEAETPACGTGIVAAALAAQRLGLVRPPVRVETAGGDVLQVGLAPLTLAGPAEHAFQGQIP